MFLIFTLKRKKINKFIPYKEYLSQFEKKTNKQKKQTNKQKTKKGTEFEF